MSLHPRIAILALTALLSAQSDPKSDLVKRKAEELAKATIAGNFAVVIDMTYPKIVEMMGGREKAISLVETGIKTMKENGASMAGFRIGDPSEFKTGGSDLFTVIPTEVDVKLPDSKLTGKSFLVGVSSDQGKTWFFADGAQLNEESVKAMFPKFPGMANTQWILRGQSTTEPRPGGSGCPVGSNLPRKQILQHPPKSRPPSLFIMVRTPHLVVTQIDSRSPTLREQCITK